MGVNNVEAVDPESLLNEVDVNAMPEFGDIGVKECLNHDVGNVDGEEYRREFFNCDEVRACLELLVRKMWSFAPGCLFGAEISSFGWWIQSGKL